MQHLILQCKKKEVTNKYGRIQSAETIVVNSFVFSHVCFVFRQVIFLQNLVMAVRLDLFGSATDFEIGSLELDYPFHLRL